MFKLRSTCRFCTAPFLLLCVLWAFPNAHAQVASSITGSVTDPTGAVIPGATVTATNEGTNVPVSRQRSEEHTSELQSQSNLVCRLLLEKKKKNKTRDDI